MAYLLYSNSLVRYYALTQQENLQAADAGRALSMENETRLWFILWEFRVFRTVLFRVRGFRASVEASRRGFFRPSASLSYMTPWPAGNSPAGAVAEQRGREWSSRNV